LADGFISIAFRVTDSWLSAMPPLIRRRDVTAIVFADAAIDYAISFISADAAIFRLIFSYYSFRLSFSASMPAAADAGLAAILRQIFFADD
jgi:hypothetical protein